HVITNTTDDRHRIALSIEDDTEAMADCILSRPVLLGETFVHHHLIRLLARVGEHCALNELDPHTLEVAGLHAVVSDVCRRPGRRRDLPLELECADHEVLHLRRTLGLLPRFHAGYGTSTLRE